MLAALLALTHLAAPAQACAMLVHTTDTLAESAQQQAIFTRNSDGSSTVSLRAAWEGDAADFGWVIAVPDSYQSLADGDAQAFIDLEWATNAIVETDYDAGGDAGPTCGCLGASKGGDLAFDTGFTNGEVSVIDAGFTGTYTYTVVTADAEASLQAWLDAHGWSGASLMPSLGTYVSEGGWAFVLVELAATSSTGSALPPLTLSLADDRMVFPARMGKDAGPVSLRTTWWVIGEGDATLGGWSSTDLPQLYSAVGEDVTAFQAALEEVSAGTAKAARTYAGDLPQGYVTRFDALVPADANTVDATFTVSATRGDPLHTVIAAGGRTVPGAALALPLGLAAWGLRRRRPA